MFIVFDEILKTQEIINLRIVFPVVSTKIRTFRIKFAEIFLWKGFGFEARYKKISPTL
jgi:hypothetical protein